MARLLLFAVLVVVSGCGGAPTAPSAVGPVPKDTANPPIPPAVTSWVGSKTLTAVTGGECVAATFSALTGTTGAYELRVTQHGSSATAIVTDPKFGFVMNYTGTADASSMSFTPQQFYTPGPAPTKIPCATGVGVRELELDNSTITAKVSGDTITGTVVDDFDVTIVEPSGLGWHYTYVGELVLTSTFVLTR